MAEFDLIPESYRRGRSLRRVLARFAITYAAVAVCVVAARSFLSVGIDVEAAELERLRASNDTLVEQRAELDVLEVRRAVLEREVAALDTLRGGPAVDTVFRTVSRTLTPDVWFVDWRFLRAGEFVDVGAEAGGNGYLLLVPKSSGEEQRAWRMKTHMEVRAQALTHSALAGFVQRLSADPIVAEIRLLSTRSRRYTSREVVDFEIAVVIRTGAFGA